ncbi:uncharacterized protein LOC124145471 [Haliotis rufescens]|uniref:uncharacterized protein LOC124145471 n=1 Tax=Haliotis rufescens TaxID=6454 RepID=UPI001EB09CC3|nr:uncharacterized protein LOC124145471 [Haliotis rufescens]
MNIWIVLSLCIVAVSPADDGPCFEFSGNSSYLEFEPENFDLYDSAHYKLSFKTTQQNGILLYARGSHDYEAIYIRGGKLIYDLYNPTSGGAGGTFGVHFESNGLVNNDRWVSVEVFRNRRVRRGAARMPGQQPPLMSGLVLESDGEEEEHVQEVTLVGVHIQGLVYVGGAGRDLSPTVREFKGKISDIWELKNDKRFEDPSRNSGVTRCLPNRGSE